MQNTKRNSVFDLLKLVFAVIIALLHYNWRIVPQGYLAVEFFLILGGGLIYKGSEKYRREKLLTIFQRKLSSVYFYYVILMVLGIAYILVVNKEKYSIGVWMLRVCRIGLMYPYIFGDTTGQAFWLPWGHVWYIPVWLVGSILCIMIVRDENMQRMRYVIVFVTLFLLGVVYNASEIHTVNVTIEVNIGTFSFGFIRGLMDLFIGMLTGIVSEQLASWKVLNKRLFSLVKGLLLFLDLSVMLLIITHEVTCEGDYIFCFLSACLICMINMQFDWCTNLLDKIGTKLGVICQLSIPIYFFHLVMIKILAYLGYNSTSVRGIAGYLLCVFIVAMIGQIVENKLKKIYFSFKQKIIFIEVS